MPQRRRIMKQRIWLALPALACLAVCIWGVWFVSQPSWAIFLAPDATNIRYQQLAPGLDSLTYTYSSSVPAQSARLQHALAGAGWLQEGVDIDCGGPCLLGGIVFVYRRQLFFNRISEVATIEQQGAGPYHVRVVLRRCLRLPGMRCWPPA
jgi:hypothetical protein